jgi:hypothetical protein
MNKDKSTKRRERGVFERPAGSGIWWVRYADGSGKIHREKVGPKGLARKVYEKRKVQVREGKFFPEQIRSKGPGPTFAEAIDEYVSRHEPLWKAFGEWKRIAGKWKDRFNGRFLDSIVRNDIEQVVSTLARQVKPGTVNRHLTLLKAFFRDAVANKKLENNPAQFIKKVARE